MKALHFKVVLSKPEEEEGIAVEEQVKTQRPSMFKVILLNDDFTPMDFVMTVLKMYFDKNDDEAFQIMMEVHNKGAGIAGVYQFDIAETKAHQVNSYARQSQHPLKCITEREDDHVE